MKNLYLRVFFPLLLLAQGLVFSTAHAKVGYVVDELLVGIHQGKNIDSPIIKILSTGTELEILERDGDYTRVREKEEGKTGWVDSSYVMLEKPAKIRLAELKASMKTQGNQGIVTTNIDTNSEKKIIALNKEIESLTQNLSSEKLNNDKLTTNLSEQKKKLVALETHSENDLVKTLQEKNKTLNLEIKQLQKMDHQGNLLSSQKSDLTSNNLSLSEILKLFTNKIIVVALFLLFLLGFLLGRHWEDRQIRRRHGGFRI